MITDSKSVIVHRLFRDMGAARGDYRHNPITGASFVWGDDPIKTQKEDAIAALSAREWFAIYGPRDAPSLPLSQDDVESYRQARGLRGLIGLSVVR